MDRNVSDNEKYVNVSFDNDSKSAVNSLILDYYQKFGKKRDLEQFFSLSTAQSDIRDPTSTFWRRMKVHGDSSDSGEGKTGSSTELCRISIKCTLPESSTSQDEHKNSKDESESPPIIIEESILPLQAEQYSPSHTDNESLKSDDNNSQKSIEAHLDISNNKPFSPTSSINSQRKLEWDSLGDVGYGNESERKASGSSLSTLERLALHQQYSNNDSKDTPYGVPTCHSTPVEPITNVGKKSNIKKTTKIHKKDIDIVELNVPHASDISSGGINVNLTKHISFNVDKDGDITIGKQKEDTKVFPNKISVETEMTPQMRFDKEIQTSLLHSKPQKGESTALITIKGGRQVGDQKFPILISLNSLRKRTRRKKFRNLKKKVCYKAKRKINSPKILPEKSGSQISKAESFEYMPGHMYNQNQVQNNNTKDSNSVGNKSSLESSIFFTSDSSKSSKNSFTKDLEKSVDLLKKALHPKYDSKNLKEKLIKEVVQRLLTTKYKDDDNASAFLSSLSYNNKRLGIPDSVPTTTSTSEANNVEKIDMVKRPKKSILRMDKFNPRGMASTSQSTPNLHTLTLNESPVNALKTSSFSNTESDFSSRERNSSDTITKLSSEELYKKYLEALKREQVHKQILKGKEAILKSKLVCSDSCIKTVPETCDKSRERLYKLIKDLAGNNVDDGSGDGNKIDSNSNFNKYNVNHITKQKSHSVFTLTSGKSIRNTKFPKNKTSQNLKQDSEAGSSHASKNCCCHLKYSSNSKAEPERVSIPETRNCEQESKLQKNCHFDSMREAKIDMSLSKPHGSNKSSPRGVENVTENMRDVQYACLCPNEAIQTQDVPDKLLIYKCSRISKQGVCLADTISKESTSIGIQCYNECFCGKDKNNIKLPTTDLSDKNMSTNRNLQCAQSSNIIYPTRKASTSSQTNANLDLILRRDFHTGSDTSVSSMEKNKRGISVNKEDVILTQSIQTEISIDPKISDPTLSDVKLVNDLGCVKLGSEQEICNSALNKYLIDEGTTKQALKLDEPQTTVNVREDQTAKDYDGNFLSDIKNSNIQTIDASVGDPQNKRDKFSIPIQGTNMTLVVSLGSKTENASEFGKIVQEKTKDLVNNQCLDPNLDRHIDSYSKGVQCKSTDIFIPINNGSNPVDMRQGVTKPTNICSWRNEYDGKIFENESIKPIYATENFKKFDTYPKKVSIPKKPFLRSNTHTGRLEAMCTSKNANISVDTQKEFYLDALPKDKNVTEVPKKSQELFKSNDVQEKIDTNDYRYDSKKSSAGSKSGTEDDVSNDPLLNIIQDITKRYTKRDIESSKRKKCFKEIITVLNYLLDTEESSERNDVPSSSKTNVCTTDRLRDTSECQIKKTFADKGVQLTKNRKQKTCTESSDLPTSSELPTTSTDSTTCKVLNKIRKECEKYHQKRCRSVHKKCDDSSTTTTLNCETCNRQHHCPCRSKCKGHKTKSGADKAKKKCVAYNLIIQTSDSVASEETTRDANCRQLQDIIVKVPPRNKQLSKAPFKEVSAKIEKKLPQCSPRRESRVFRSKSLPNDSEMSSEDFARKLRTCTVRDYLEMNRPDFVERCTKRQTCLKLINQTRPDEVCGSSGYKLIVVHSPECSGNTYVGPCNTICTGVPLNYSHCANPFNQLNCAEVTGVGETNERANKRKLLSQQLERQQTLNALSSAQIEQLAKELGAKLRRKKVEPKFISEHEMKKHSEKIYKTLPEVVKKREELKKENGKRTNLLMANIFKKNLQKKTLCGSVNLSNYSTVLKI